MSHKGNLQLPPPQLIIFNVLLNLQKKSIDIHQLFQDSSLVVEPMMFEFS